ncbi:alpha/beta hydrolase family protein [uncultured Winogradskyella sp.]|uniref:alpha/beta hydrolase family protein n=1 Tax=uncultured Winogradskyella sp. TaxID=395353 RepID=UPI003512609D
MKKRINHALVLFVIFGSLLEALGQTTTHLFDYDSSTERAASVVQRLEIDSVTTFEKVVLDGFDSKIPFYHYINKRTNKNNYVILLHGLGDSKEDWIYPSEPYLDWSKNTTAIKDSLVSLGYNIIIPDVKFHGERSYELGFRPPEDLPPGFSKNEEDSIIFETLVTSTVKDLRIIMDYIQNSNNNSDLSFNVIGYSLGGNLAILLSIFDNRITSIVGCVPPVNLPARDLEMLDWPEKIKQAQMNITPMTHAKNQKTPTLLLMGKKDFFANESEVSGFFEKVSTEEKKLKYFDAGHILPNTYKVDAIEWITQHNNP